MEKNLSKACDSAKRTPKMLQPKKTSQNWKKNLQLMQSVQNLENLWH